MEDWICHTGLDAVELLNVINILVLKGYRIKLKCYNNRSIATCFEALICKGAVTQGASGDSIVSAILKGYENIKRWESVNIGVPKSYKSRSSTLRAGKEKKDVKADG